MRFWDPGKKKIVYILDHALKHDWDSQWLSDKIHKSIVSYAPRSFVSKITERYCLPKDGPILEAGCGLGQHVYSLQCSGFESLGLDNASNTVAYLNKNYPDINIKFGDVRQLPYGKNSLQACWSLGVIEHFYYGYEPIISEASRVIKPNGYFFVSHPYISTLRKIKIFFKLYKTQFFNLEPIGFYQYLLPKEEVVEMMNFHGFKHVKSIHMAGLKGFKDEMPDVINKCLAKVYKLESRSKFFAYTLECFNIILGTFAAHSILHVFQKE